MLDIGGTLFCERCAEDAFESGVFVEDRDARRPANTEHWVDGLRVKDRY
jgi:hypothetical protein